MLRPDAILIAGPTASGKSRLALDLASRWDGEIINTDSMQIYPVLNVLTARPNEEELNSAPHHLYGYAPIAEAYSVARWLEDAKQVASKLWDQGKVPIFVGGTGLYFKALEEGLAFVPIIPSEIRSKIRAELLENGSEALYQRLQAMDSLSSKNLRPSDGHRIARALEVVTATGISLVSFQSEPAPPAFLNSKYCRRIVLMPERPILHERINLRADLMIEQGAIEEVKELMALHLPADATALKAIGVSQLTKFILGEQNLKFSIENLKASTRQYAKRQSTWFKGQFDEKWLQTSEITSIF